MNPNKAHHNQKGVAIIMVLLVFFMATMIISGILLAHHYSIKQSDYLFTTLQSQQYALGAEARARQILYRDATTPAYHGMKNIDYLGEEWAPSKNIFPIDNGQLFYRIEDLQSRFNLNNITKGTAWVIRFQLLLASLQINPVYAQRLLDWVDENNDVSGANGAEENEYLLLTPPYRAANQPLQDVSELRLLLGMKEKDYQALRPYVAVLPAGTPININTASEQVLKALSPELTGTVLESVRAQQKTGFKTVDDFLHMEGMPATVKNDGSLSVSSQYFAVTTEVHFGQRHTELKSVLYRQNEGNITLLSRDFSMNAVMDASDEKNTSQSTSK